MSDIVDDLLQLSRDPDVNPRHRRQTMDRFVRALLELTNDGMNPDRPEHRASIARLSVIIGGMASRIAQADDAAFSAIVQEAAMLVRCLQRRQAEMSPFTLH